MADRPPVFMTAPVVVANSNAETSLISTTVPANTLRVGSSFRVMAQGIGSTTSTAQTMTFRLRIGGETLTGTLTASLAQAYSASQTNKAWRVDFDIIVREIGSSGEAIAGAWAWSELNTTVAAVTEGVTQTSTVALDTTIPRDIELSCQWTNVNVANSLSCQIALIEVRTP